MNKPHDAVTDPGQTIIAVSGDGGYADYGKLRDDFRIYPGEDGCKYQDLKLLGMGGMGVVYSGNDPTLERNVAIKILREPYRHDREQIAKFINEARITARIDHPNIVAVHQLGVNEHHGVYFSMRQISGETLQNVIRHLNEGDEEALRHYTLRRLLDIFIAGCNGVAAAHEKKILHCDLKPANIMIGRFGEVLVLDWGLAREFDTPATGKNQISGTPAYMAPELVSGISKTPDEKSEVYALGTILHTILTWNTAPFDMEQEKDALLEKVAAGKYSPLRNTAGVNIPRELAAICRKAMALDRNKRYATVTDLLSDLYNFRDGRAVEAYSPNIFYRFFKLCLRHPAIPIAVIVAALTLSLYNITGNIFNFVHDRSLLSSSQINLQIADDFYRKTLMMPYSKPREELFSSPLKLAVEERNMQLQANLALTEYFSILDAAAGLTDSGKEEFSRKFAAFIFRRILNLQIMTGDAQKIHTALERCRRWEFFATACQLDPELAESAANIDSDRGIIFINSGNQAALTGELISGDYRETLEITGNKKLKLAVGNYELHLNNGLRYRFRVLPGGNEKLNVVLPPEKEGILIPKDHFFCDIAEIGKIRCDLPAFILRKAGSNLSADKVEKLLRELNGGEYDSWRLPSLFELQKAFSVNDSGENFYGVPAENSMILLKDGRLFDPATGKIKNNSPVRDFRIYVVKVIE